MWRRRQRVTTGDAAGSGSSAVRFYMRWHRRGARMPPLRRKLPASRVWGNREGQRATPLPTALPSAGA